MTKRMDLCASCGGYPSDLGIGVSAIHTSPPNGVPGCQCTARICACYRLRVGPYETVPK